DHAGRLAFHNCDAGIGGAEVDANDLAHGASSLSRQAGRAQLAPIPDPQNKRSKPRLRRLGSYRREALRRKDLTASEPIHKRLKTANPVTRNGCMPATGKPVG